MDQKQGEQKQGEQKPTKELIEEARKVETFNPLWHDEEFLGPNAVRFKDGDADTIECKGVYDPEERT